MIRVLLADDQALVRAGFRVLLSAEEGIEVVAEAIDGEEAVALALEHRPDIVLMDIRMPRLDGLVATARITAEPSLADSRVVVLTTFELDEYVFGALRAGAAGFLLKDMEPEALVDAVRTVAAGEALLSPRITRTLIEAFVAQGTAHDAGDWGGRPGSGPDSAPAPLPDPRLEQLTPREREMLAHVGRGRSNAEIARELVLSPLTVKTHVSRLFLKLGARDRAQLVVLAYETRLVSGPGEAGACLPPRRPGRRT